MKDFHASFNYKNILIIGLGISGCSAAHFLLKRGVNVSAIDTHWDKVKEIKETQELIQSGLNFFSESSTFNIHLFDLIVVSPGIPLTHPVYKAAIEEKIEVIGEIELACRFLTQPCIGITGSNGKTTTTLMVEHALNQCGKKAKAVGNIGTPLIQVLDSSEKDDDETILVIELSSWQLETMRTSCLEAAVITNITPNHLDRHGTMEAYAAAKFRIGRCLKPGKKLYIKDKTYQNFKTMLKDQKVFTFGYQPGSDIYCDQEKVIVDQKIQFFLPPVYRHSISHDAENLIAAYALCSEMQINPEAFLKSSTSFNKPPHRIEFVRKFKGISYYDDSKATNLDAVLTAVNSLKGGIILIAGGVHKGSAYFPWIEGFKNKVRGLCVIGEAAEQLKHELSSFMQVDICENLEGAIRRATQLAKPGENVLLSPGCASFDMFKDYKHRGEIFQQVVNELK